MNAHSQVESIVIFLDGLFAKIEQARFGAVFFPLLVAVVGVALHVGLCLLWRGGCHVGPPATTSSCRRSRDTFWGLATVMDGMVLGVVLLLHVLPCLVHFRELLERTATTMPFPTPSFTLLALSLRLGWRPET